MTIPNESSIHKIHFYATAPYSCSYLTGELAQSLIAAPHHLIDANIYNGLIQQGFRRSGKFAYRPYCERCDACTSVRIPVLQFKPNRSQQRAFKKHANLQAYILPLAFKQSHFELYEAYQEARHEGIETNDASPESAISQYQNFLVQTNVKSFMIEFLDGDDLKMVSVVDVVADGVSAVYTFYDTTDPRNSYGSYNIVWLANWCKHQNLPYLYLGYWIDSSKKMAYKKNFQPQEHLIDGEWVARK